MEHWTHAVTLYEWSLLTVACICILSGLDDAFVDFVAFISRSKARKWKTELTSDTQHRNIAIMIPAWDESEIIFQMLHGNAQRLKYGSYRFFVGVYPNDPKTIEEVRRAQARGIRVEPVINSKPGPTSKGQMLNEVVRAILEHQEHFDAVLLHDAEDVIHPDSLDVISAHLTSYDFIQIPVFSLPVSKWRLVAGTYIDEFAESHTKDLLARQQLGAAIPSAGVGTALSSRFIRKVAEHRGAVFRPDSLTEDYELGILARRLGLRSVFACYFKQSGSHKDWIATREYFPKTFSFSVRQKTRWTLGIAYQGTKYLGWSGNLAERYFLWRDRKGVVTNVVTLISYPLSILSIGLGQYSSFSNSILQSQLHQSIAVTCVGLMSWRLLQRGLAVVRVYGFQLLPTLIMRWPVGVTINAFAAIRATRAYFRSEFRGQTLRWDKTKHELPQEFAVSDVA